MRIGAWLAAGLLSAFAAVASASAKDAAESPVQIEYAGQSGDDRIDHARDVLMGAQSLEELRLFMSPLRMPTTLKILATQCGAEHKDYDSASHTVSICYENIAHILDVVGAANASDEDKHGAAVGAIVTTLLHETAYAIFDIYNVPIWGRIDDAADRLAALVMTQFGTDTARTTILGTAHFFDWSSKTWTGRDFAASSAPEAQRFYNFLCVAIGADEIEFGVLVDKGIMPLRRGRRCYGEYQQIKDAFNIRIMPYVDPDAFIQARAHEW